MAQGPTPAAACGLRSRRIATALAPCRSRVDRWLPASSWGCIPRTLSGCGSRVSRPVNPMPCHRRLSSGPALRVALRAARWRRPTLLAVGSPCQLAVGRPPPCLPPAHAALPAAGRAHGSPCLPPAHAALPAAGRAHGSPCLPPAHAALPAAGRAHGSPCLPPAALPAAAAGLPAAGRACRWAGLPLGGPCVQDPARSARLAVGMGLAGAESRQICRPAAHLRRTPHTRPAGRLGAGRWWPGVARWAAGPGRAEAGHERPGRGSRAGPGRGRTRTAGPGRADAGHERPGRGWPAGRQGRAGPRQDTNGRAGRGTTPPAGR